MGPCQPKCVLCREAGQTDSGDRGASVVTAADTIVVCVSLRQGGLRGQLSNDCCYAKQETALALLQ